MGDGHLKHGADGHLIRNSAGHLVNACTSLPPCNGVPLACPPGTASSYLVSLPSSIDISACLEPGDEPSTCGPADTSAIVTGSCGGFPFQWVCGAPVCIAGYTQEDPNVELRNSVDGNGCPIWDVLLMINVTRGFAGFTLVLHYSKLRAGATINDITGAYTFREARIGTSGVTCSPIVPATITVS